MKQIIGGLIIVSILCATVSLFAEELAQAILPPQATTAQVAFLQEGIYGRISLDLRQIDIHDALKYFSLKSGLNIVTSKSVSGRVTLIVEDVPVKDVFDIMLRSTGLAYDKVGSIYNVMTQEEYKILYGKRFADIRKVKVFRLQYAVPEQAFSLLDTIKSEVGRILVDPESGTVLCMDSPEKIEQMQSALDQFERKGVTRVFDLNYALASDIEEHLKSRLDDKKVGSIKADVRANQVVVHALPKRIEEIAELIEILDKKTKEVLIEAKILKIKLGNNSEAGVEWEGIFNASENNGLTYVGSYPFSAVQATTDEWRSRSQVWKDTGYVGSYPFSGTSSNYSGGRSSIGFDKMHVGVVGSHDFDFLLKYLTIENEAKILSNPKIAVVNKQEARIHVGEKQAYVTTTTTSGQSTSTISENVTFIDIGIQLNVTPTINEDDFVRLQLKTEVSSVVDVLLTPTENKIPIVDTSLAETVVLIKGGKTIIIAGLRKDEKSKIVRRVPIFSKIPLLGKLFQTKIDIVNRTELLIMVTPQIITGDALEMMDSKPIGAPDVKDIKEYGELEKRRKELETYQPVVEELGGMKFKNFKVYEKMRNKD
ncbi:MAG: hypothetical protein GY853_03225 [PVC group bacterium]|nr:hypothetical protein [PVC group bacterium]